MGYRGNGLKAVDEYAKLALQTNIETASPHRLILMLIEGALEKIRGAKLAMQVGNIADKGANISWAISIIDGLRASLNLGKGGDMAANLDGLYEYATRTLAQANLDNSDVKLDEVATLLLEIRAAWKAIEDQVDQMSAFGADDLASTALALG